MIAAKGFQIEKDRLVGLLHRRASSSLAISCPLVVPTLSLAPARFAPFSGRRMPYWSVARTLPKREGFAAERLAAGGFEVFLPMIQTKRATQPLFAGYCFCRIVEQWRSINSTLGVLCLVRVDDCPARCPDREIDSLKAMIDGHGFVRLPDGRGSPAKRQIAIGAKVRIASGPFGGWTGLYAGQGARDRERVLLALLGRQTPVLLAGNLIVPQ
jgi:transcription antitermination factor NusG